MVKKCAGVRVCVISQVTGEERRFCFVSLDESYEVRGCLMEMASGGYLYYLLDQNALLHYCI